MAGLIFFRDEQKLFEHRLRFGKTVIGRADICDIVLPGAAISRRHCVVEQKKDRWQISDHSRHGLQWQGRKVQTLVLQEGMRLDLGPYSLCFSAQERWAPPTATMVPSRDHEFIVAADRGKEIHTAQASLEILVGPGRGKRIPLMRSKLSVGGEGSDVVLPDPKLRARHCIVRVSRGRVMVESGRGPAFLDGHRLREITPLYAEEDFRIGDTLLRGHVSPVLESPEAGGFGEMVGDSLVMQKMFGRIRRFAAHDFPVLIMGESGTGKELAAHGIHLASFRSSGPFVPINCAAIASSLIESELFGHVKGAFTGATSNKKGAFQQADKGTLFLDELGELSLAAQSKLLRVLENGEVRPVGSDKVSFPNVRVLAATNRNLRQAVREGAFREDLLFRLSVLSISIPPLRVRMEDLPLLSSTLLQHLHPEASLTVQAMDRLKSHSWPGNIRELRNVLSRGYVLSGPRIEEENISFFSQANHDEVGSMLEEEETSERKFLLGMLKKHHHNQSAVARELGIARTTLVYRLKKHGIR